jgi:hypothetical protein
MTVTGARSDANDSKAYWIPALRFPESYGGQPETPLDQDSARAALDELFTLAGKYNSSDAYLELMRFVGRFPFYSPFNAMLIYTQMPGPRFVCTARRWRKDYHREIKISAHVVGVGLEGQPEHRDGLAAQAGAHRICDLAGHRALAVVVDRQHGLDDPQRHVVIERDLHQRAGVLWETRAAETRLPIKHDLCHGIALGGHPG